MRQKSSVRNLRFVIYLYGLSSGRPKKKAHLLLNLWMTKKKDQEIHPKFLPPRSVMSYWGARLLSTVLKTCGTRSYLGGSDRLRPMAGPPQDPEVWPCTAQKRLMCHDRDGTQMASFQNAQSPRQLSSLSHHHLWPQPLGQDKSHTPGPGATLPSHLQAPSWETAGAASGGDAIGREKNCAHEQATLTPEPLPASEPSPREGFALNTRESTPGDKHLPSTHAQHLLSTS